jgi:hypothetical protein
MITTTATATATATATEQTTELQPNTDPVASIALDEVTGGWFASPYAAARYVNHLEYRAERLERRVERFASWWGY